jgi:hypothetical protein
MASLNFVQNIALFDGLRPFANSCMSEEMVEQSVIFCPVSFVCPFKDPAATTIKAASAIFLM